jgi:hypothetical protein
MRPEFLTGREDFEREIKFVGNSELYFNGNLLKISEELIKQIKQNRAIQNFTPESLHSSQNDEL